MFKKFTLNETYYINLQAHKTNSSLFVSLSRYKGASITLFYWPTSGFTINGWIRRKTDHPGFTFEVLLFGFGFELEFNDSRHWDYVNNKFEE